MQPVGVVEDALEAVLEVLLVGGADAVAFAVTWASSGVVSGSMTIVSSKSPGPPSADRFLS